MIGRSSQTYENARFVPPDHTELDWLLQHFEAYINTSQPLPTVVVAALMHYQFEAIHPFMDGNGRVGRLLISLYFVARKALEKPLLYLSAYLEQHDDEYRDHLLSISQRGTWVEWITFFARGVEEQSQDAVSRARQLLNLQRQYREKLQTTSQSSTVLRLIDSLFQSPFVTVSQAMRVLGVTRRAAKQNIEKLLAANIVMEYSHVKRGQIYQATEIFKILNAQSATQK
jgi:Fic family protein